MIKNSFIGFPTTNKRQIYEKRIATNKKEEKLL